MTKRTIVLCDFRTSPKPRSECYAAIWSQGRSCKRCEHDDCYRQGWEQWLVTADNKARVKANQACDQ
ncbi:hypothetical protein LCGC14_2336130 [marine sediment metagenome]|uniref:Uncharacterized protein n=1 Tax=marine sediment metagenome TaxID=412755 RepID=A0A0F9CDD6_9ZZZZ